MNLSEWKKGGEFFEYRGLPIFYRRSKPAEEVLLCLHGFPTSSYDYRMIWDDLSAEFAVLTFDMIGYGFSAKPQKFDYTTFEQVNLLQELLGNLKVRRIHILSHDYGNTIVQELLARQAEGRLDFSIMTVCFMNGALFPETHRPILAQKLLIGPIGFLFGRLIPDSAFARSLASVFGKDTRPSAAELEDYVSLFKNNGGSRIGHKLIQYMSERTTHRERWVEPLRKMMQPFMLVNGSDDPVSGRHLVERFREVVPTQTNIVEMPGVGHFPHLEMPGDFLENFLYFHGMSKE